MTKKTKITLTVVLCLAVIGAGVWYFFFRTDKPEEKTVTANTANDNFPLNLGSKGNNVLTIQKALNYRSGYVLAAIAEDGIFGNETKTRYDLINQNTYNGKLSFPVSKTDFDLLNLQEKFY